MDIKALAIQMAVTIAALYVAKRFLGV